MRTHLGLSVRPYAPPWPSTKVESLFANSTSISEYLALEVYRTCNE